MECLETNSVSIKSNFHIFEIISDVEKYFKPSWIIWGGCNLVLFCFQYIDLKNYIKIQFYFFKYNYIFFDALVDETYLYSL